MRSPAVLCSCEAFLGSPGLSLPSPLLAWALLSSPGFPWALLGSPVLSWVLLCSSGFSCALLGSLGPSWVPLCSPVPSCALLCSHNVLPVWALSCAKVCSSESGVKRKKKLTLSLARATAKAYKASETQESAEKGAQRQNSGSSLKGLPSLSKAAPGSSALPKEGNIIAKLPRCKATDKEQANRHSAALHESVALPTPEAGPASTT